MCRGRRSTTAAPTAAAPTEASTAATNNAGTAKTAQAGTAQAWAGAAAAVGTLRGTERGAGAATATTPVALHNHIYRAGDDERAAGARSKSRKGSETATWRQIRLVAWRVASVAGNQSVAWSVALRLTLRLILRLALRYLAQHCLALHCLALRLGLGSRCGRLRVGGLGDGHSLDDDGCLRRLLSRAGCLFFRVGRHARRLAAN